MDPQQKKIFMMMGIFAVFMVSMIISSYYNAMRKADVQKARMAAFGKVQFKGKVTSYRQYKFMNKPAYQVCVKLDSGNVNSLYIYNDNDALKIKDSIATFSAGYLINILGPIDSVAVNIGNSGKIFFHYKAKAWDEHPLGFDPNGLQKSDLNYCN
jgi:hypothetical protein